MGTVTDIKNARAASRIAKLLDKHSPQEIADAIEILIEVLDTVDGDADREDDNQDTAVDDGPCDEDFDREPGDDSGMACAYGVDQTNPVGVTPGRDIAPPFVCASIFRRSRGEGAPAN